MQILFFNTRAGEQCSVYKLWNNLQQKKLRIIQFLFPKPENYLINDYYDSFTAFQEKVGIKKGDPKKMTVFGYKDIEYPVLLSAIREKYIKDSWFNWNTQDCVSVFFVK